MVGKGGPEGPAPRAKRSERFQKADRLLSRREFLRVQGGGRKYVTRHLVALALPGLTQRTRLGLVVSTKVGGAVDRNRVKRWLREIFRKDREALTVRVDLVLIAKKGAPEAGLTALRGEFLEIARKLSAGAKPREAGA